MLKTIERCGALSSRRAVLFSFAESEYSTSLSKLADMKIMLA